MDEPGWVFERILSGNSVGISWEYDNEPPGVWGNRKTVAWFDGFLGQSGVLGYANYFDRYLVPGQSNPTSAYMEGRYGVKLTWNPGDDAISPPSRIWVKSYSYTETRLQGNSLGSYGSGLATTSNANYSGSLFGGSFQIQNRVNKFEVIEGKLTLPNLTLNSGTNPSSYATYGYVAGEMEYTIYPNPVLKAGNTITYRKGNTPNERIANTPDGNGRIIEHKAVGIIPIYHLGIYAPTASTNLNFTQSVFSGNNVLYDFSYWGDGNVANSTPLGIGLSPNRFVDILMPTVSMDNFPNEYGRTSKFNVIGDDSSVLDYDSVDASTEIKWHFPYENIQEELVNFNYHPLTVVSTASPGYYYWENGELNERMQQVSRYDLMTCNITNGFIWITGVAIDLISLPTIMTFSFSALGFMNRFEESIQKSIFITHQPSWSSCWNNVFNGSIQDSYPRSTFNPDRSFPETQYQMIPVPYGKFDGYHVNAEKYSENGYDGIFDHSYARYVHKDVPVGAFIRTNSGGGGGGWGPGGGR